MRPCRICGEDHDDRTDCPHGQVRAFQGIGASDTATIGALDVYPDIWLFATMAEYVAWHRAAYPD